MSGTPEVVSELDKPFFLVLILLCAVIAIGGVAIFLGRWNDAKDFIAILSPLLGAGVGLYFKSKA